MDLQQFFSAHPKIAIAFSGGVDSSFLFYAAAKYAKEVHAYFVKGAFQPEFEMADAEKVAAFVGAPFTILHADVLADERVTANPANRCYYCKQNVFSTILEAARADGFTEICDGTNASDDASDRPGMKALQEMQVLSPLRLCGLTKAMIRQQSKAAGLFTWDKPSYACLATRIPTGQKITAENLARTEKAEGYLFSLGFSDFRIRTVGDVAKIQLPGSQFALLMAHRKEILQHLQGPYSAVTLDLEARDEK